MGREPEPAETSGSQFVVVETVNGEGLVGEIPEGATIPNCPGEPMPIEVAEQVAGILNETDPDKV